jgi:hypothetical protein
MAALKALEFIACATTWIAAVACVPMGVRRLTITHDRPMSVDIDQCRGTRILFLTMALSMALPCLAQTQEPFEVRRAEAAFEELPVLNASEILRPEFLKSLNGVANRDAFVRTAGETSSDEQDAIFCVQTAALMSKIHKDESLARITNLGDFPVCVAKDGTIIVALQWDYAAWTSGAAGFTSDVQKFAAQSGKNESVFVVLSGQVSLRLRQELETRGLTVHDRLAPGPLR